MKYYVLGHVLKYLYFLMDFFMRYNIYKIIYNDYTF